MPRFNESFLLQNFSQSRLEILYTEEQNSLAPLDIIVGPRIEGPPLKPVEHHIHILYREAIHAPIMPREDEGSSRKLKFFPLALWEDFYQKTRSPTIVIVNLVN